jgi:AcrR family transcriptional regulator
MREQLCATAVAMIAAHGYEETTLRDIAKKAGVSAGLLYRYFPNKRAVVLAMYDELSAAYAKRAATMPAGSWGERFLFALTTSLAVLQKQRGPLAALVPILIGDGEEGLFAPSTAFSRQRVQAVFAEAVLGAADAPERDDGAALGRLLYAAHLAVILFWLLDKSPRQRASRYVIAMIERALPLAAIALHMNEGVAFVRGADTWVRQGLFGEGVSSADDA